MDYTSFMAEDKKKEIAVAVINVTEEYLKEKLYEVRGKKVLLDADLAEIYGYTNKRFNEQVRNNIEKFDPDFMFELKLPSSKPLAVGAMTREELDAELQKGVDSIKAGKVYSADEVDAVLAKEFGI